MNKKNTDKKATLSSDSDKKVEETPESQEKILNNIKKGWFTKVFHGNGEIPTETLGELIESREEKIPLSAHERLLLGNILKLKDLRAMDVMTQRADIDAIEAETSINGLIEQIAKKTHSRLPVYNKTLDDIVGIVHVKDVINAIKNKKIKTVSEIMNKDVLFISPAMRVLDLLRDMQMKRTHMVMVVDEYGGIDGLITIEILIEQIVGEIDDEHDNDDDPEFFLHADGSLEADARVYIEDFEEAVGDILTEDERDEDIDTLGGLVFHTAGRMPVRGEIVKHSSGLHFWIMEADPRRIKKLMISNFPKKITNIKKTSKPTSAKKADKDKEMKASEKKHEKLEQEDKKTKAKKTKKQDS